MTHLCSCPCGETQFEVKQTPFTRFYCHCNICQLLYGKPYSDVVVVQTKHVVIDQEQVKFKKYRSPPALKRGTCPGCGKPAAGFLNFMGIKLAFIAAENFQKQTQLPPTQGHVFYHRKVFDVEDHFPKYAGYWNSEWQVAKWVWPHLRHR